MVGESFASALQLLFIYFGLPLIALGVVIGFFLGRAWAIWRMRRAVEKSGRREELE